MHEKLYKIVARDKEEHKSLLVSVFKNTKNTSLVFYEYSICSFNLIFFYVSMFVRTKKNGIKYVFLIF